MAGSGTALLAGFCLFSLVVCSSGSQSYLNAYDIKMLDIPRLRKGGCLPADFKAPDFKACVENESSPSNVTFGPLTKYYNTYVCIAELLQVRSVDKSQLAKQMVALSKKLSSDGAWLSKQATNINSCFNELNIREFSEFGEESQQADSHAAFMMGCWHQLLKYDCDVHVANGLGAAVNSTDLSDYVDTLVKLKHDCNNHQWLAGPAVVRDYKEFQKCGGPNFRGLSMMSGLLDQAILDATSTDTYERSAINLIFGFFANSHISSFSWAALVELRNEMDLLRNAFTCLMTANGEMHENGDIDYSTMLRLIADAPKPKAYRDSQTRVVQQLQQRGVLKIEDFLKAYYDTVPAVCAADAVFDLMKDMGTSYDLHF